MYMAGNKLIIKQTPTTVLLYINNAINHVITSSITIACRQSSKISEIFLYKIQKIKEYTILC
jgi:hypothetical protein